MEDIENPSEYNLLFGTQGRQGKYKFYTTTMKLREVYSSFKFYLDRPEEQGDIKIINMPNGKKKIIKNRDASVREDIQRIKDPNKVEEIIQYLRSYPDTWIFSSIVASCDSTIIYKPLTEDERIGKIYIRKGTNLLINDGQHRADAISKIWNGKLLDKITEDFGDQSISVVIFEGEDIRRKQQMFVDLQKGTPVNKSLQSELSHTIDHKLVREVRDSIDFFRWYVLRDQTSVGRGSKKLITQKSFYDANVYVFGKRKITQSKYNDYRDFLIDFWKTLSNNICGWEHFLEEDKLDTDEFRSDNLSHLSVTMHAFGMIASRMYHNKFSISRLKRLNKIDWSRDNYELMKLYTTREGKLANNIHNRRAIRDYLWEDVLEYRSWSED